MNRCGDDLEGRIRALELENAELKKSYLGLQESQQELEGVLARTNESQLRAEMDSLELEQIFLTFSDAIWVINEDGMVIRANQAMLDLLGLPQEQVVGHHCKDLLPTCFCQTETCPLSVIKTQDSREYDIEIDIPHASRQSFILSTAPLTTIVGTTALISQYKNITLRKKAEQKLEQLNRKLTRMARVDGLTQIANRRYFDETLEQEWRRLSRTGAPLSLLLADIDYFKKYNDCYGHQAGDSCLVQVAASLQEASRRPADLVARYGGEEFALLLPEIEAEGLNHVAQRAIENVAALAIKHEQSDILPRVSLSLGGATLNPIPQEEPTALITLADAALYRAKRQGRNRLVCAEAADKPGDAKKD